MKIKTRHKIKKSKVKHLIEEIKTSLNIDITTFLKDKNIEIAEFDGQMLIIIDRMPALFVVDHRLLPTLKGIMHLDIKQPEVVVDSGAVSFIVNGANVMAPGIIEADESIQTGDIVVITEERYGKPLAIGEALKDGTDMVNSQGRAVKSIHHVGDKIWKLEL